MVIGSQYLPAKEDTQFQVFFFTDNILPFTEAIVEQATIMKGCLNRFCSASGQKSVYKSHRSSFLKIQIREWPKQ